MRIAIGVRLGSDARLANRPDELALVELRVVIAT